MRTRAPSDDDSLARVEGITNAVPVGPHGRRLRVVHVVSTLNIGGLEMALVNLARHHSRERFELQVICLGELGPLAEKIGSLGIPVETIANRPRYRGSAIVHLAQRLRYLRPDVVHTHNPGPHLHGSIAALLASVPVLIHTKHGRNYLEPTYSATANRLASRLTSFIVAVSDDAAAVASSIEGVPPRKLAVLRNGVDLQKYRFRTPRQDTSEVRAIHVARLNWIKDQPTLLRASQLVADAEPRFRLDIIGDGPERDSVERLIDELGIRRIVTMHGFRENVADALANADFFVLSSASEGVSLTLLEAMAVGLPIVATDVGGNREVVVDGATGILTPPKCPAALAEAMLKLIRHPQALAQMGIAARERVECAFDLRQVVRRYEALYETLFRTRRFR